jgi:hypothetical protein
MNSIKQWDSDRTSLFKQKSKIYSMKNLIYILFLLLWGCTNAPQGAVNSCSDKPTGTLDSKNVETVSISNTASTLSGNASAGKDVGYTFNGNTGQKLSYQTQDDICVWVIAPDTEVLSGGSLPKTGLYTLQISVPKGAKTFKLDVSFGDLSTAQASPSAPNSDSSQPSQSSNINVSPSQPSASSSLDQATASQLVADWLNAKSKIFAAPFDRSVASQYTTGPLYNDITKPGGSIDWLQNNGSYYRYDSAKITDSRNFSNSGNQPSLEVTIYEDRTLQGRNGIDQAQSGSSTKNFTYYFQQENGQWKIYDYRSN